MFAATIFASQKQTANVVRYGQRTRHNKLSFTNSAQDENNGCGCYHLTTDYYTRRSKAQVQDDSKAIAKLVESMKKFYDEQGEGDEDDEPKEPEVTCASKDYSAAIDVDASFLNKLADKFCSGEVDKKRSQDLTAKDISSGAYEGYKFHFELDPGDNCKTDCKAAFKSMTGKCMLLTIHADIKILVLNNL